MTRSVRDVQAFFGPRAAGWDERFPDDGPAYSRAVADLDPPAGGVALDLGCGTGRALEPLRAAVGDRGVVVGLDATPEMLMGAAAAGRARVGSLLLGDAAALPLRSSSADVVLAAEWRGRLFGSSGELTDLLVS